MSEAELQDWQARQYPALRARINELSRAYAVQGLAIEELTAERDDLRARMAELEKGNIALRGIIANLLGEKP